MNLNNFFTRHHLNRLIGLLARGLFVLVKPAALWVSIQFDTDSGLMLSQVFLIAMVFMALTGTNAHKNYYRARFDQDGSYSRYVVASRYLTYIEHLGLQVFPVVGLFLIATLLWPGSSSVVICFGLIFGIAEKISDEGIRHTQFSLNNLRLLGWAVAKLCACWAAVLITWQEWADIGIIFPPLLLVAVIVFGGKGPQLAILKTLKALFSKPARLFKNMVRLIWRDLGQVAWVFTCVAFFSFDKWLLQILQPEILPKYMFAAQIASVFLTAQAMAIVAPSRVKLITQNPTSIPILRFGSGIFCSICIFVGAVVWVSGIQSEALVFIPFFLTGIFVLLAPYLDRFYWITSDLMRFATDFSLALSSALGASIMMYLGYPAKPILVFFGFVLLVRFGVIVYFVRQFGR